MSIDVPRSVVDARNTLHDLREQVRHELDGVVVGYDEQIDLLIVAAVAGGHVLLEGPPGIAKTLMAGSIARVLGVSFKRVQFTPDTTPEEITGRNVTRAGETTFHAGRRVHERPARRRDQPDAAADAGGAARGDAGAARHGRRPHALAAGPVHGDRDPEPLRAGGDLPAARVAARPLPVQDPPRLRLGRRSSGRSCGSRIAASRPTSSATSQPLLDIARLDSRRRRTSTRPPRPTTSSRSSSTSSGAPARSDGVVLGASPRAAIHLLAAAKAHARLGEPARRRAARTWSTWPRSPSRTG